MEHRKYSTQFTTVEILGDNGKYFMVLNGAIVPREFTGTIDEAVSCSMQIVMAIYSQVVKEIADASDKYIQSIDKVPVQSEERPVDETDGGRAGFKLLHPEDVGTVSPSQDRDDSGEQASGDQAPDGCDQSGGNCNPNPGDNR
jgi:hypothetical protein